MGGLQGKAEANPILKVCHDKIAKSVLNTILVNSIFFFPKMRCLNQKLFKRGPALTREVYFELLLTVHTSDRAALPADRICSEEGVRWLLFLLTRCGFPVKAV